MLNWKKVIQLTLAFLCVGTTALAIACDNETPANSDLSSTTESGLDTESDTNGSDSNDTGSGGDSSDTNSGGEDIDAPCEHVWTAGGIYESPSCTNAGKRLYVCELDPDHTELREIGFTHEWSEWTFSVEPTCTEGGEKIRHCLHCEDVTETAPVAAWGHKLDNGICERCEYGPVYPEAPDKINYRKPTASTPDMGIDPYVRFSLNEGYYEFTIGKEGVLWVDCKVPSAGQYALYSTNTPTGVTAKNHGSNTFFINEADGVAARSLPDGNFYASINVSDEFWHDSFCQIFAFRGAPDTVVQVRFVRIDEAQQGVKYATETVYPRQIGEKAKDSVSGMQITVVPYTSKYYYDETSGYYRMGTSADPGEIIYVAITKKATRINDSLAFADLATLGVGYALHHHDDIDGTKVYRDYAWFLCNYGGVGKTSETGRDFIPNEGDENALCYENYVNNDGVYPVTPELKEFLELYVSLNTPVTLQGETNPAVLANAWLAACYYYKGVPMGEQSNPIPATPSTFQVTTREQQYTYYAIFADAEATETRTYTATITDENAFVYFEDKSYKGAQTFTFTLDPNEKIVFYVGALDYTSISFTITVTENNEA
ncbi:MAG: hypothetical protein IJ308_06085 [Clostridia bacterium]|nr:hypothetical protein [Clostridia bacterium]